MAAYRNQLARYWSSHCPCNPMIADGGRGGSDSAVSSRSWGVSGLGGSTATARGQAPESAGRCAGHGTATGSDGCTGRSSPFAGRTGASIAQNCDPGAEAEVRRTNSRCDAPVRRAWLSTGPAPATIWASVSIHVARVCLRSRPRMTCSRLSALMATTSIRRSQSPTCPDGSPGDDATTFCVSPMRIWVAQSPTLGFRGCGSDGASQRAAEEVSASCAPFQGAVDDALALAPAKQRA
jgi:hypothetical protein